jgi:hypothetical protein
MGAGLAALSIRVWPSYLESFYLQPQPLGLLTLLSSMITISNTPPALLATISGIYFHL